MDLWMVGGGSIMLGIGILARVRSDLLWRLYSLEPRWRKDNPEQPDNWDAIAKKHSTFLIGFGVIFMVLSVALVEMAASST